MKYIEIKFIILFFSLLTIPKNSFSSPSEPLRHAEHTATLQWTVATLDDEIGQLDVQDIAKFPAERFQPLDHATLHKGFTNSSIWLKITLVNPHPYRIVRWLELSSPLLEHVGFYKLNANRWEQVHESEHVKIRKPTFELDLHSAGESSYFVKLKTRTAMSTRITLWEPTTYLEQETKNSMLWNLMYGSYLTIVIFYFAFWIWSREKIHLLYSIYVGVNFSAAFITEGWPLTIFSITDKTDYTNFLGIIIGFSIVIGVLFTLEYLETKKYFSKTDKIFKIISFLVFLICSILIHTEDYSNAARFTQASSILIILASLFLSIFHIRFNSQKSLFFIIAFAPFYTAVVWRYLRNINVIESGFLNDNAYQFGAFFHMILMSYGIFASYNRMRLERNQAETKASAQEQLRLQQNDFMAMLSHETRTPLAVILASAENSLLDSNLSLKNQVRIQKIIKAGTRIKKLLTQLIEKERYFLDDNNLKISNHDLIKLIQKQVQESRILHEKNISIQTKSSELIFDFDPELIRIAIANLVENAIQHSDSRSTIEIQINQIDQMIEIIVSNSGLGVPEKELPHIFNRYYRGENSDGFGLGLYLVNQITKIHHGELVLKNRLGEGCDFYLRLPKKHPLD